MVSELPLCIGTSACGIVQVNAFGVSSQHFCRCPRTTLPCQLNWDPQDGHSVTQGSNQFKVSVKFIYYNALYLNI